MIEVYARRRNSAAAAGLVARLRSDGLQAREGNSDWFDARQADPSVDRVYHDGENPLIPSHYDALAVPCELIPGAAPETAPPPGIFRVEQTGQWYALIGPDGEKVGKSQRTEADAWALRQEKHGE